MARKTTPKRNRGIELLRQETLFQGHFRIERVTLRHPRNERRRTETKTILDIERGNGVDVLP
jgi:hypothetical protein